MSATPERPSQKLIQHFKMEKIPAEGPWFAVTYRSQDRLDAKSLPLRYQGDRIASTAIYAVQTMEDFSAMHKLMTDEIWHFYGGNPLEMLLLYPDGRGKLWSLALMYSRASTRSLLFLGMSGKAPSRWVPGLNLIRSSVTRSRQVSSSTISRWATATSCKINILSLRLILLV